MKRFSEIIDDICVIVRDETATTKSVIEDYLKAVLDDLQDSVDFTETSKVISKTVGGDSPVFFSVEGIKTNDIVTIKDTNGAVNKIRILPRHVYDSIVPSTYDGSNGRPTVASIDSDVSLSIYPTGRETEWEVRYNERVSGFSATSKEIGLPNDTINVIKNGVLSEVFDWKDDNRANKYFMKYERGKRSLRKKYLEKNVRLRPEILGNLEHPGWNAIFGS